MNLIEQLRQQAANYAYSHVCAHTMRQAADRIAELESRPAATSQPLKVDFVNYRTPITYSNSTGPAAPVVAILEEIAITDLAYKQRDLATKALRMISGQEPMPASEAPKLPNGWVALSIVFDEDMEYPEEVAYGPPAMMERLGKKLNKYYAHIIAKRDAAPVPVSEAASDDLAEGVEILDQLIASIEKHGNYSAEATVTFLHQIKQCLAAPAVPTDAKPDAGWRDKLRWSKANTDYHGYIAFTPGQLEHFVSMLIGDWKPSTAAQSVRDAAQPTIAAERLQNAWNDALEEAALICDQQAKEPECPERAEYCADEIRALKGRAIDSTTTIPKEGA